MSESEAVSTGFERLAAEGRVLPPPPGFSAAARVGSIGDYEAEYGESIEEPEAYWLRQACQRISWIQEPTQALSGGFEALDYSWFADGELNVSANCLDRHLLTWRRTKAALIWEGDDGSSGPTPTSSCITRSAASLRYC